MKRAAMRHKGVEIRFALPVQMQLEPICVWCTQMSEFVCLWTHRFCLLYFPLSFSPVCINNAVMYHIEKKQLFCFSLLSVFIDRLFIDRLYLGLCIYLSLWLLIHRSMYRYLPLLLFPCSSILANSGDVWQPAGGLVEFKVSSAL